MRTRTSQPTRQIHFRLLMLTKPLRRLWPRLPPHSARWPTKTRTAVKIPRGKYPPRQYWPAWPGIARDTEENAGEHAVPGWPWARRILGLDSNHAPWLRLRGVAPLPNGDGTNAIQVYRREWHTPEDQSQGPISAGNRTTSPVVYFTPSGTCFWAAAVLSASNSCGSHHPRYWPAQPVASKVSVFNSMDTVDELRSTENARCTISIR